MLSVRLYPNQEVVASASYSSLTIQRPEKQASKLTICAPVGPVPPEGDRLDIVTKTSQSAPRAGYGSGGLSKKARIRLRRLSGLFSEHFRDRQVFVTGTLPGSTLEAMERFARQSSAFLRRLQTYLPREFGIKSSDYRYLWVWEHQKRGALHLHMVLEFDSVDIARRARDIWRSLWNKCLVATEKACNYDIFEKKAGGTWKNDPDAWQSDAQLVKKSVGAYLSKYLSKGGKHRSTLCPGRWWGCSRSLRAELKKWIKENSCVVDVVVAPEVQFTQLESILRVVAQDVLSGYVTKTSQWYQANVATVFGFNYQKKELRDIMKEIRGQLELIMSEYVVKIPGRASESVTRARMRAKSALLSKFPIRVKNSLEVNLEAMYRDIPACAHVGDDLYWSDFIMLARHEARLGPVKGEGIGAWGKVAMAMMEQDIFSLPS